jgi:hypothetical protein
MRFAAPLLIISFLSLTAQERVSKVAFSEGKDSIHAFSPSGDVTIPLVTVQLDISRTDGKQEHTSLGVVYDPQTGHYLWLNARPSPETMLAS